MPRSNKMAGAFVFIKTFSYICFMEYIILTAVVFWAFDIFIKIELSKLGDYGDIPNPFVLSAQRSKRGWWFCLFMKIVPYTGFTMALYATVDSICSKVKEAWTNHKNLPNE